LELVHQQLWLANVGARLFILNADGFVVKTFDGHLQVTFGPLPHSVDVLSHTFYPSLQAITCACVMSGGHQMVSGSKDTTVRVWNLCTGAYEHGLHGHDGVALPFLISLTVKQAITTLCVLSDHRVVSGSSDKSLRVWDLGTGVCEHVLRLDKVSLNVYSHSHDVFRQQEH
jgi:WD40 repeat protein